MGDAFHEAAVAEEHPGAVIDHREAFTIELRGEHLLGQCHADCIGHALPQRTGRRLHTHPGLVLRVARRALAELPEIAEFVHADVVTGEVQEAV